MTHPAICAATSAVVLCSLLALYAAPPTLGSAQTRAPAGPPQAKATIHADEVIGRVNPLIFGHNVEAADPQHLFGTWSSTIPGRTGEGIWDPVRHAPVPESIEFARQIGMRILRYPGGCLVHNFNWKNAVGPVEQRPDFAFGVDEFIEFCRGVGAEPLMMVSDYVGGPQDAADLVEYLNAPSGPAHPWAQKRAAGGHAEPYGIVYFEMGNESDHGNHQVQPPRKFTAAQYAEWFNDCSRRMRAVDPTIRMGALMGTGTGPDDPWNAAVLARTAGNADFIVVHTYAVGLWGEPWAGLTGDRLMRACMAASDQLEALLARYREVIRRHAGRDLPLAITEYNAAFVQEKPVPYRYSYGAALFSADYVRVLMQPQANVLMANYWHFMNGYWGMVQGPNLPGDVPRVWRKMPAFCLYRLWAQHFGERLVRAEADGPRLDCEGALDVRPAQGAAGLPEGLEADTNLLEGVPPEASAGPGWRAQPTGPSSAVIELTGLRQESYPRLALIKDLKPGAYALSFEARSGGDLQAGRFGLGLCDARGWEATHSANAVDGVEAAADWTPFRGELSTLPDCPGLAVLWRLVPGASPASGRIELRSIKVTPVRGFPAYAAVTSAASLSADGRTLYVILFNKHHAEDIAAQVEVAGFSVASARAWTVTGPSLEAVNLEQELVREVESGAEVTGVTPSGLRRLLPARSMTAFELRRG
jgi:alpha-N-arabinofuranosidase